MGKLYLLCFIIFSHFSVAQVANDTVSVLGNTKQQVSSTYKSTKQNVITKFQYFVPKIGKKKKPSLDSDSSIVNNFSTGTSVSDTIELGKNRISQVKNKLPQVGLATPIAQASSPFQIVKDSTNSDSTKTSEKVVDKAKESSLVKPFADRFQSLPVTKDSSLKDNGRLVFKNSVQVPHFDLKEKADLKGKSGGLKNKLVAQKIGLQAKAVAPDSLRTKTIAFAKQKVKELNPKGNIAVGYEYGVLPSVLGDGSPTGGYRAEGQVGFNVLNLPLIATFNYSNIKNVVGLNNYFRISYDANQYKEQLAQKLNVKDKLTQTLLSNLQSQQQQLLQQMEYTNMLSQSFGYQNPLGNDFNTNGLGVNYNLNTLNTLYDTSGMMSNISQYSNGLNQYANLNDTSTLNQLNGIKGGNKQFSKKDSIMNVIAVNKAKYDSINKLIADVQQQKNQIKNLQNNPAKLDNPYLSKVQNFMSHIKKLEIGLCNPNYSTFLLNNIPLQGINVEYEKNNNFFAITYGTTLNSLLFNTNTLQGTLQGARNLYNYFDFGNLSAGRKILSVKGGVGTKEKSHLFVGFLVGKGKTDYSLPLLDPTAASVESNLVVELDGKYVFTEQLSLDVVIGKSSVKEDDLTMEQIKKSVNEIFSQYRSYAVLTKLNVGIKKINTKLTFTTRWIDPYFKSYGLGFMRSDNLRYEAKVEQPITKRIKYTIAYRREEDNLLRLLAYKTTLQSINNSLSIKLKKGFNIRLNYAPLFRKFRSADIIVTDKNYITTAIVSYIPKFKKVGAQFNLLYSRYIITGDSSNINFENYTYSHQFQFQSGFKTSLNSSFFRDNLKDTLNNNTFLSIIDIGYATEKGNSVSIGGKVAYKKMMKPQYGFIVKGVTKLYKGLFFEAEAEKIIIGDYYNPEIITRIKNFPFYINLRLNFNF